MWRAPPVDRSVSVVDTLLRSLVTTDGFHDGFHHAIYSIVSRDKPRPAIRWQLTRR